MSNSKRKAAALEQAIDIMLDEAKEHEKNGKYEAAHSIKHHVITLQEMYYYEAKNVERKKQ